MPDVLTNAERGEISAMLANYAIDSGIAFRSLESDPIHKLVVGLVNFGYDKTIMKQRILQKFLF